MSASETSKEDRQLPASERRLQQAREEGQVVRSRDLVHLAAIGAMLTLLLGIGPMLGDHALGLVAAGLRFDRSAAFEPAMLVTRLSSLGMSSLSAVVPVLAAVSILMAATTLAVGGWNFTLKALEPKFERIDPLAAIGRMLQWRQLLSQLRVVMLAAALIGIAAIYARNHIGELAALASTPFHAALSSGVGWLASGLAMLLGVCFVSALADVPMQIFKHNSELKMTLEEVKQENKESEGDPHVKSQRRQRQRELSRGRMLASVPTASVVVTNPTHYAVALQYDESSNGAPRIVAMGCDHLALKIREVAAAAGVPTLEAPPLARALYRHGDLDREVPVELYSAVAQVLAWVFRLRTAVTPVARPTIEIPGGMDPLEASP